MPFGNELNNICLHNVLTNLCFHDLNAMFVDWNFFQEKSSTRSKIKDLLS